MRQLLASSILVVLGVTAAWDIYSSYTGSGSDTVSRTVQDWSVLYPVLPFSVGVIIGHLFWPVAPILP